jgi:pimeloyl-ACP methyl ester carboxylesterase
LIHGISTSCQTLTQLALALARRGRRVLLFDLFGRGFSDGVGDLPHDDRLYVSQTLLVIASSPLPWSGDDAFDLVGYSMGGCVAVSFAAAFPRMVGSLVLLAPAGLIRAEAFGRLTRFVFQSGVVPERLLAAITRRRLRRPIAASAAARRPGNGGKEEPSADPNVRKPPLRRGSTVVDDALGLLSEKVSAAEDTVLSPVALLAAEVGAEATARPHGLAPTAMTDRVGAYVRWMLSHHDGFVPAFMSCVRFAPLVGQHEDWARLASRAPGSVCVVLGRDDEIIHAAAYEEDARPLLGDAVQWHVVPGRHDFVMTNVAETLEVVFRFWSMDDVKPDGNAYQENEGKDVDGVATADAAEAQKVAGD